MACVGVASRVTTVTSVHQVTSTTRSVNSVVAVQSALCLKSVMQRADASVNPSFRVLGVNSADLGSTPTPTVKCAPVILAPHWTAAAQRQVTATACPITAELHATSVHQDIIDTQAAYPATALQKALATAAATR